MARGDGTSSTKVFLVHGRNLIARDELTKLLTAYGLDVLQWSDVRELTGVATPSTLDIVSTGISSTQCTVVLLTGDELVRLDPHLEDQDFRVQPRPNVIFEAGWALGTLGSTRTILVKLGNSDLLTDIDGLNYVIIGNDLDSRIDLAKRLKDAGCVIDGNRTIWLNPAKSADFSLVPVPVPAEDDANEDIMPEVLEGYYKTYADLALSLRLRHVDLLQEIRDSVAANRALDLKYHYVTTEMAEYWTAVCRDTGYGHDTLVDATSTGVPELVRAADFVNKRVNIVSLGPGDGRLDVTILERLNSADVGVATYFPVDISSDLIRTAVTEVQDAFKNDRLKPFPIKAINADFETTLFSFMRLFNPAGRDLVPNLFLLSGFTLGNSSEDPVINSLIQAMDEDDVLLVDARLHELGPTPSDSDLSPDHRNQLIKPYSSPVINRFAFGPVEVGTRFKVDSRMVKIQPDVKVGTVSVVPSGINVFLNCHGLLQNKEFQKATGYRVPHNARNRKGESVTRLATVTFYDFDDLSNWFRKKGFDVVWSRRARHVGLFGVRRRPDVLGVGQDA